MDTVAVETPQTKTTFSKLWGASGLSNLADGIGLTAALPLGALFGGVIARTFSLATPMLVGGGLLIIAAFAIQPIVNNRTIQLAKENANQYKQSGICRGRNNLVAGTHLSR